MNYLYLDFETYFDSATTLSKMTLAAYLGRTRITGVSVEWNADEVVSFAGSEVTADSEVVSLLRAAAERNDVTFVAHNAAFDMRVLTELLPVPWPKHIHCSMELARGAWPNHGGGYSLDNLGRTLDLGGLRKIEIDLREGKHTQAELDAYCANDVAMCRAIHQRAIARLPREELVLAELCTSVRRLSFDIDPVKVQEAHAAFDGMVIKAKAALTAELGDEWAGVFGHEQDGTVRSVKSAAVKRLLMDNLGFDTHTISRKLISPGKLTSNLDASAALENIAGANKALSHRRNVAKFAGRSRLHAELGYFGATATGRFTSAQPGCKGVNVHNCVGGDTPVLTDYGWVPIIEVTEAHRVWTGECWAPHGGVVHEGKRQCLRTLGMDVTPEHPIWVLREMVPVGESTQFQRALALVAGSLSKLRAALPRECWPAALNAALSSVELYTALNGPLHANGAACGRALRSWDSFLMTSFAPSIDAGTTTWSTDSAHVGTRSSACTGIASCLSGSMRNPLSATARDLTAGIVWISKWIESTSLSHTGLETSASSLPERIRAIGATLYRLTGCRLSKWLRLAESRISVRTICSEQDVYDLTDCGKFQTPLALISNCPKRNPLVAKAVRSIFRWRDRVAVRADLANVEYRVCSWLTDCAHTERLFSASVLNDPYLGFGNPATGRTYTKADPVRQAFKAAVLGLNYGMSCGRFMCELSRTVSDPVMKLPLEALDTVVADNRWGLADLTSRDKKDMMRFGIAPSVAIVARHLYDSFHRMHPELMRFGRWMERAVQATVSTLDPAGAIDRLYLEPSAPNRAKIDVRYLGDEYGPGTRSLAVYINGWPHPCVQWRDLGMREVVDRGVCITAMHPQKGFRPITLNICLENPGQAAGRIGMSKAQVELASKYDCQFTIHDELMLLVPPDREAILEARADIARVLGPGNSLGWDWAVVVDPSEINVSKSMYEVDMKKLHPQWWAELEAGNDAMLDLLP